MIRVIRALKREWAWTGVTFATIHAISPMGHLVVSDKEGVLHYVDPQMGQILRLGSEDQVAQYLADPEVRMVWHARNLVTPARARLGMIEEGEVYALTPEALLAGDYAPENVVRMDLAELISFAGQVAYQTRDLPDGTAIQLKGSE